MPAGDSNGSKKKRIRFIAAKDYLLLQAVCSARAHVAPHGETGRRFDEAARTFVEAAGSSLGDVLTPSMKTVRDRFTTVIEKRKVDVKRTTAASGIVEERGAKEELMDDLIFEMEEHLERKRAEEAERTEKEKQLVEAGEEVRRKALSRLNGQGGEKLENRTEGSVVIETEENLVMESSSTRKPRLKRRAISLDSDNDERDAFIEEMNRRKQADEKCMKVLEERLELDRIRCEREGARQELDARRVTVEEKRLQLDERKYEMEVQERRATMEERKGMVDVLSG